MLLCLPAGHLRTVRLIFWRGPGRRLLRTPPRAAAAAAPAPAPGLAGCRTPPPPGPQLTARQRELLRLVAAGHTNAQAARRLGVTEKTVGKHLENVYARLRVSSRTAAITRAFRCQAAGVTDALRQRLADHQRLEAHEAPRDRPHNPRI
jgi:DNA-binding CsgD family transcriptional regulator